MSESRWTTGTNVIGERRTHKTEHGSRVVVAAIQQDRFVGAYLEKHYDRNLLQHPSTANEIAMFRFTLLEWQVLPLHIVEHDIVMPLFAADLIDAAEAGVDAPSYLKLRCKRCGMQLLKKMCLLQRAGTVCVDTTRLDAVLSMIRMWFFESKAPIPAEFTEGLGDCVPRIKCPKHDCKNFVFVKDLEDGNDCGFHGSKKKSP